MAASYPTSLKVFTSINCNDKMSDSGKTGVDIITELQEELAAIQTKVGIDGSAVTTSHSYKLSEVTSSDLAVGKSATQTLTNKTINGSNNTITNVSLTTGVTGTLPIANGGTGQTSANAALNALLPSQTGNSGKFLSSNGTDSSWVAVPTSDGWYPSPITTFTRIASNDPVYQVRFVGDLTGLIFNGMRIKWTQNSVVRYGIIVDAGTFSTPNHDVRILTRCNNASADHDVIDTASFSVTNVYLSTAKIPHGFYNGELGDWTVSFESTSDYSDSSGFVGYQNVSGSALTQTIPYGRWNTHYTVNAEVSCDDAEAFLQTTLSTSTSSASNNDFTACCIADTSRLNFTPWKQAQVNITTAAGVAHYIIAGANATNITAISFSGSFAPSRIVSESLYF